MGGRHIAVDTEITGSTATVVLTGELDVDGAGHVQRELESFIGRGVTQVAVDMGELSFLDSSGLRALIQARDRLVGAGIGLRIERASDVVQRVLDITGTAELLTRG